MNVNYVGRETASNLSRNITLTLASIITVAVSLALAGSSFLVRQGVQNATLKWRGGIEFIVFMKPDISDSQRLALQKDLEQNPQVKRVKYVDRTQALAEFKRIFKNQPEYLQVIKDEPDVLPPSFRVVPVDTNIRSIVSLQTLYEGKPGVYTVETASSTIKTMQRITGVINIGLSITAIVLVAASALLIFNTIQTAMYARRREIEVMKLVGATNWFIRVPFMLEGLIQGLIGALIAVGSMFALNHFFSSRLASQTNVELLQSFVVDSHDVVGTSLIIGIAGAVIGLVSAAVAATWFLDV